MIRREQTMILSPYMEIYDLVVPKDNKKINELIDFSFIYDEPVDKYCLDNGRAVISPIRMFYGIQTSHETISKMTDKILPYIHEWQDRQLEPIYAFVYFDAVPVKDSIKTAKKAVYTVVGIDLRGHKDVLGFWISETESSHFWISAMMV